MNKFPPVLFNSSVGKKGRRGRAKWERSQLIQQKRCCGEMEPQEQWGEGRTRRVRQRKVHTAHRQKVCLYKIVTSREDVYRWGVSSDNFPVWRNFLLYATCCLTSFFFFFTISEASKWSGEKGEKKRNWSSNRVKMWKGSGVVLPFKT